jgi:hypothetical protein
VDEMWQSPRTGGVCVTDEFPWTSLLPPADRDAFVVDITRTVAVAGQDSAGHLSQVVYEWRATAEVHSDPKLARRLCRPITTKGKPVPRPAS